MGSERAMGLAWRWNVARVAAATLALFLFSVVDRGPLIFFDTKTYFAVGERIAGTVHLPGGAPTGDAAAPDRAENPQDPRLSYTAVGSRSPYYALGLYLLHGVGGFRLVALCQCLLAAALLLLAARRLGDDGSGGGYGVTMAVLTLASTIPVFTALMMPDLLAPLATLAAMLLLLRWQALRRGERIFCAAVVAAGALSHGSIMLTVPLLVGIARLVNRGETAPAGARRRGMVAVLAAGAIGVAGYVAYPIAVRHVSGQPVYDAPFVAARLFTEGPGRAYLHAACARDPRTYELCRFRDLPFRNADEFLWFGAHGFHGADYDTRVAIDRQQWRFVLGTIGYDPMGVAANTARNIATLALHYGSGEPAFDQYQLLTGPGFGWFTPRDPGMARCVADRATCGPAIRPTLLDPLYAAAILLAIAAGAWLLWAERVDRRRWLPVVAFLLLALATNAIVCATISGTAQRYQSRMLWLIPAIACLMGTDALRRRREADRVARLPPAS